ncbi:anamorsin homolog [Cephus cinctus]|uniref:Anamorsin homolog n=1 Tax=Cephus cinctus TaxID=211228 RepID=A0AAJ7CHF6_CEPCN|nr:anamorsin homolog [Cephus cinctus]XP_015610354.1 anamorsin homolog [Cephus cinctus]XP_024935823.1 anamorsin homolog [Cephus cinctus]
MAEYVKEGNKVLIVSSSSDAVNDLKNLVDEVKEIIKETGVLLLENVIIKKKSDQDTSSIDVIYSGFEQAFVHDDLLLAEFLRILKPGGKVLIREPVQGTHTEEKNSPVTLASKLKLNGFLVKDTITNDNVHEIVAEKPFFEIGSSITLSFTNPKANVWKLDSAVDDDLINDSNLLDETDILKPQPASLRVCSTTGKRKACKDCSCGLAEELAGDVSEQRTGKSSCGNCYLGDAFRCASCPYLGMPAFKPGEKVTLPDTQLTADS